MADSAKSFQNNDQYQSPKDSRLYHKLKNTPLHLLLILLSIVVGYPILWLILASLKDKQELFNHVWELPQKFLWSNFIEAWQIGEIGKHLINSVIITVSYLFILVIVCYLASYALARIKFTGRNLLMALFVATMMIPVQVILIPLYKLETGMGIIDTRWGLILPYIASGLSFSVFLLTSFLETIPVELEEAAYIDGCNRWGIIWRIMLPLSRAGLATIIIFQFMFAWNDFFLPLVILHNPDIKTITLGLMNFQEQWGVTDYTRMFAALTIINVPVIIVYAIFQKQFIKGLIAGAVKM